MRYFRRSALLRLVVLPFTLTVWLSACHKWVALEPPYGLAIEAAQTDELRVTVAGEQFVLKSAVVSGDTLLVAGQTLGIHMDSLQAVDARAADIHATAGTVLLAILAAGAAAFGIWALAGGYGGGGWFGGS